MIDAHYDISCDSCGGYYDGDPIGILARTPNIPKGIHDPAKMKELMYFWLCRECKEDYPNGAKDFFTASYFTDDELYLCNHCEAFIPEEVRDEFEDTEVCLTCSPRDEEDV
jgi:phage terminase large subunit GpA-like protein